MSGETIGPNLGDNGGLLPRFRWYVGGGRATLSSGGQAQASSTTGLQQKFGIGHLVYGECDNPIRDMFDAVRPD